MMDLTKWTSISAPEGARAQIEFVVGGKDFRLDAIDTTSVLFENADRVRAPGSWKHKRNYAGYYWAATTRSHVWFESLYEKAALMRIDRDATVVGVSAQPMWIHWPVDGPRRHAPDYFVRYANGECTVVDVKPANRIGDADALAFSRTAALCESLGWRYRVVSDISATEQRNLRFLSGYRYDRWKPDDDVATAVGARGDISAPLETWVSAFDAAASEALGSLYWALWWGVLSVDMNERLSMGTVVRVA